MEPKDSLSHSQEPATCPYSEPEQSSTCHSSYFLKIHFNIIVPSTPGSHEEVTFTILSSLCEVRTLAAKIPKR